MLSERGTIHIVNQVSTIKAVCGYLLRGWSSDIEYEELKDIYRPCRRCVEGNGRNAKIARAY
jgi:hypothetical protein